MLPDFPIYLSVLFIIITLLTVFIFYRAMNKSAAVLIVVCLWLATQAAISLAGIYTVTNTIPPRFVFSAIPVLVMIAFLFFSKKGKLFIDSADLRLLTIIHIVRIPVELLLHELYIHKAIPQLMTYEGRNFDILSGMTAPIIFYCAFIKKNIGRVTLLAWNFICLGLLVSIVAHGILSAPFRFQQFGFEQPNIAIFYFPFVWLPFGIVLLVLLAHLISIRRLIKLEHNYF